MWKLLILASLYLNTGVKKELLRINAEIGQTYKENLQSGLQEQVENYQEVRMKGERK